METERVIFFRNFLFRTLILGVLFTIGLAVFTFTMWDTWAPMAASWFKIEEKELGEMMLNFFLQVRIVLVFFFLSPALALHWMLKSKK